MWTVISSVHTGVATRVRLLGYRSKAEGMNDTNSEFKRQPVDYYNKDTYTKWHTLLQHLSQHALHSRHTVPTSGRSRDLHSLLLH